MFVVPSGIGVVRNGIKYFKNEVVKLLKMPMRDIYTTQLVIVLLMQLKLPMRSPER